MGRVTSITYVVLNDKEPYFFFPEHLEVFEKAVLCPPTYFCWWKNTYSCWWQNTEAKRVSKILGIKVGRLEYITPLLFVDDILLLFLAYTE